MEQKENFVNRGFMPHRNAYRWLLLCTAILALILIPFFLFGNQIETWTDNFLRSTSDQSGLVAIVLGLLLASDILLPVPSSMVSTATGFFLGFMRGIITSLAGMTVCCIAGFWLGAKFGRPIACRLVGNNELKRLEKMSHHFGEWVIVVSRPIPVAGGSVCTVCRDKWDAGLSVFVAVYTI